MTAQVGDNAALIQEEAIARVNADSALGTRIDTVQTQFDDNIATVRQEIGVVSDSVDAASGLITTVQRQVNGQTDSVEVSNIIGDVAKVKLAIAEARLDASVASLQAQSASLDTQISTINTKIAVLNDKKTQEGADVTLINEQIAQLNTAKTDAQTQKTAIASQVTQINQQINDLASLKDTQSKLLAESTIKLNARGHVASIGLAIEDENDPRSSFIVQADQFAFGSTDAVNSNVVTYPFIFRATAYTDPNTGTSFPVGAYMKAGFLDYASIKLAHIDTASISSLSALSATIGKFASSNTGPRLELSDTYIRIYDENGLIFEAGELM